MYKYNKNSYDECHKGAGKCSYSEFSDMRRYDGLPGYICSPHTKSGWLGKVYWLHLCDGTQKDMENCPKFQTMRVNKK